MTQATVCVNYGLDAVATWVHGFESKDNYTRISRGLYGVDVGLPRVLDLHEKHGIPATFWIPGYNVESFPEATGEIVDHGHEIQAHGWKHMDATRFQSKEKQRDDIRRAVESIYDVTGEQPTGYRSPTANFTQETLEVIQDLGFEFDASLEGNDFEPYFLNENWVATEDEPFDRGTETEIVELPLDWLLVDFIPFTTIWSDPHRRGYGDESVFFGRWYDIFEWMYNNKENGVFIVNLHPQVVGRIPRLTEFERFLEYVSEKPGVEYNYMSTVAEEFAENPQRYQ